MPTWWVSQPPRQNCGQDDGLGWKILHLTSFALSQEDNCPQFLAPDPLVIPMNHETEVTFQGKNLETVKVEKAWGEV